MSNLKVRLSIAIASLVSLSISQAAWSNEVDNFAAIELISNARQKQNEDDNTPLHRAAISNDVALIHLLLLQGADINSKNKYDRTPLYLAVSKGNFKAAKFLLEQGADYSSDSFSSLPLIVAVEENRPELVRLLLKSGAKTDRNKVNYAYDFAKIEGYSKILEILTRFGAKYRSKEYVLEQAVKNENLELVKELVNDEMEDYVKTKSGNLLLYYALDRFPNPSIEIFKYLITKGANINSPLTNGFTILHKVEKPEIVRLVIEYGANIDARFIEDSDTVNRNVFPEHQYDGQTPLHFAAREGNIEKVKILLENGAYLNAVDSLNRTPLHLAIASPYGFILPRDYGIYTISFNLEERLYDGRLRSKIYNAFQIVKLLLDAGADLNIEGKFDSPKQIISKYKSYQIKQLEQFRYFGYGLDYLIDKYEK